jgi:hypothetical protein
MSVSGLIRSGAGVGAGAQHTADTPKALGLQLAMVVLPFYNGLPVIQADLNQISGQLDVRRVPILARLVL